MLLGHLDADGAEVGQEGRAAARLEAAGAHAAQQLGHVARADLAQIYPDAEVLRQIFAQRSEMDPVLGGVVEGEESMIKRILADIKYIKTM